MKSKTFPLVGWSLVIIGIIHNAFGFIAGWPVLLDAVSAGLIGAWDRPATGVLFWFLVTGFALIALGLLTAQLERSGVVIPWSFITVLGLLALAGVVLMPASGFWLLLFPVAVCLIRRLRR
jgi:chaperonin groEL